MNILLKKIKSFFLKFWKNFLQLIKNKKKPKLKLGLDLLIVFLSFIYGNLLIVNSSSSNWNLFLIFQVILFFEIINSDIHFKFFFFFSSNPISKTRPFIRNFY